MLTLTENASTAVRDLTSRAGLVSGGLRIAESTSERGGFELEMVATPGPGDEIVIEGDAIVFLAPVASHMLSDQLLDVDAAADGTSFTLVPQQ